jgi:CrcB protein
MTSGSRHPLPLRTGVAASAAGGALGALARWGLTSAWPHHGTTFPWATFAINVVGSTLLAAIALVPVVRRTPWLPVFLGTGVLGGFTTMSAASVDTFHLLDLGATSTAAAYCLGTLGAAVLAAALVSRVDPAAEADFADEEGDG